MMEELKSCPFCGEKAELSSGRFDGKDTSYVICTRCGSSGEFFTVNHKYASAEKAIKAWNRRVTIEPERKTGEWIGTEYDGYADGNPVYYEWECSECGCVIEEEGRPTYNYCPQCGANMRGEADADD